MHEPLAIKGYGQGAGRPRRAGWRGPVAIGTIVAALWGWGARAGDRPEVAAAVGDLLSGSVERVVVVTIDGLRPDLICLEDSPSLMRMIDEGASSLRSRTVSPCLTLPAHAAMLTGLAPDDHGILWNAYLPRRGFVEWTTVFDVARQAKLKTALFAGKAKLRHLAPPGAVDHVLIRPDLDDVDIMWRAIEHLRKKKPHLTMIHLPDVDRMGHAFGWKSRRQCNVLRSADSAVGALLSFARNHRAFEGKTLIILTADHGGTGSHHRKGDPLDSTVPWIAWGSTVVPAKLPPLSVRATAATVLVALELDPARLGRRRPSPGSDLELRHAHRPTEQRKGPGESPGPG